MQHVLSWVHTRLHGAHCSKKKSEFNAGSNRPAAHTSSSSEPCRPHDELHDGWPQAMLSIGTFGIGEGGQDELKKTQKITLLMSAKAETTTTAGDEQEKRHHLMLKRPLNGGMVNHRSFRKFMSSAVSGFLPRPSITGTTPERRPNEMPWPLLHNDIPDEDLAMSEAKINSYRTAQLPWRGSATGAEQGSKWIRTDSEYIVLEI
ncbi:unnamed protein product [Alopecurus aequalis]